MNSLPSILEPVDLEAALKSPLPQKIIRALSPADLYFAMRDAGADARAEALSLALPEQVQGIFDLDAWDGDHLDLTRVRAGFMELLETLSPVKMALHLRVYDPELITALLVTEFTVVPIGPDFEGDAPSDDPEWQSPDGRFWLWRRTEPLNESAEVAVKTLEILYKDNPEAAQKILMQAAAGLFSEMEELALHFREARLAEMGFPSLETSNGIWQPRKGSTPPAAPLPDEETFRTLAVETARRIHFRERMAGLSPERRESAAAELVLITNGALISEAVALRDRDGVNRVLGMVSGFLELGLAHPDGEKALAKHLVELFQLGIGMVAPLARRARELTRSHIFDRWGQPLSLLDAGEAEFIRFLARPHPLFSDPLHPEGNAVPFATLDQIRQADAALVELEAAGVFFFGPQGLALASERWTDENVFPPRPERTLATLMGTFLARIALKLSPGVDPIDTPDLAKLCRGVDQLEALREGLDKLTNAPEPLRVWLRRAADRWLKDMRDAAGNTMLVTTVLHRAP